MQTKTLDVNEYTPERFEEVIRNILRETNAEEFTLTASDFTGGVMNRAPAGYEMSVIATVTDLGYVSINLRGLEVMAEIIAEVAREKFPDRYADMTANTVLTDPELYAMAEDTIKSCLWKSMPHTYSQYY